MTNIQENYTKNDLYLDNIIESITQPFLIIDINTYNIVFLNQAARDQNIDQGLTCYSQLYNFSGPCNENGFKCPMDEVQKTGKHVVVKHYYKDESFFEKIREVHGYPIFNEDGEVVRVIHYHIDITEQEKEKINKHLLDTAINCSDDSIVITDNRGIVQYVNPAFEKTTGFKSTEVVKKNANIVKSGEHDYSFYQGMWDTLVKGKNWHGNLVNKKKDGSLFEEEVIISPVKDANDNIVNYLAIKRDVTGKKRLESIAEASNLMENLGYVFSGIRHEIGNPLNSIKMTLSVLLKNIDSFSKEQVKEFIERSLGETSRIEYLLTALKNFSLFETPVIKKERIDKFMLSFVSLIKQDLDKKGVQLSTEFSDQIKWGYTDLRALHQVMLNLITNALDSLDNRDNKNIKITTKKVPGLIRLTVEDTGQGMTAEEKDNLFKPFFTSKPQGTGLGLVIVKKMLSKMNSIIKIYSTKGVGTFVMILIPEGKPKDE